MAKKAKQITFTINCDIWDADVLVRCGGTSKAFEKLFDSRLPFQDPTDWGSTEFLDPGGLTYMHSDFAGAGIWFRDIKPFAHVVAHESVHAAMHILQKRGVPIGEISEVLPWLVDYLVRQIGRRVW